MPARPGRRPMARWLAMLLLSVFLVAFAACGGGDDDDDSGDDDSGSNDSSDDSRTDSSDGSGKLKVDGKEYDLDVETCELGKAQELTVIAASIKGERDGEFSAS